MMESTAIEGFSNGTLVMLGVAAFVLWIALTSQEEGESVGSAVGKLVGLVVKVAFLTLATLAIAAMFLGITA
ncbi:hypothetical protein L6258_02435 [Candidatus Parcubacteria bacterium]|nr:hypothetical protein [Candidatus Parcubacteria bacterium]